MASGPLITTINDISIHALREEGDVFCTGSTLPLPNFYPRPPRGGRHQRTGG